jgi:phosphopantetheine--protein transferase-like protein
MTSKQTLPGLIQSLFPDCVATACFRIADADARMHPAEYASIKHAVEARQQEFSAGRMCAREALKHLGCFTGPLPKLPSRSIAWPKGIIGTISHNEIWCGAAVARRCDLAGIGFDIETVTRIGENLWRRILTTEEYPLLDQQPAAKTQQWAALIFSAKESVYKCIAALVPQRIGFMDAVIVPDLQKGAFEIHLKEAIAEQIPRELQLRGRFFFYEGAVFTGLTLA